MEEEPEIPEPGGWPRRAGRSAARMVVARPEHRMPLDDAEHALYLDSGDRTYKYQRFGLLLTLSSVIASGGIALNSTATVVGAMIVAPLAIPIMGVALALVVGHGARLRGALLGVVGGMVLCILVGLLMSPMLDGDPAGQFTDSQSGSTGGSGPGGRHCHRCSVGGCRGPQGLSDVLPGVAIAIALVPPLCAAGFLIADGLWSSALGAITLFLTNVLSMILAGVAVFVVIGYARTAAKRRRTDIDRVKAGVVIAAALLIIVVPLVLHTFESLRQGKNRISAREAAVEWVANDPNWAFTGIEYFPDKVVVQVLGQGAPPDSNELLRAMSSKVDSDVPIIVDLISGTSFEAGTAAPLLETD